MPFTALFNSSKMYFHVCSFCTLISFFDEEKAIFQKRLIPWLILGMDVRLSFITFALFLWEQVKWSENDRVDAIFLWSNFPANANLKTQLCGRNLRSLSPIIFHRDLSAVDKILPPVLILLTASLIILFIPQAELVPSLRQGCDTWTGLKPTWWIKISPWFFHIITIRHFRSSR